jgi:proline racemase
MNIKRIISCIDTHTEGDPTRFLMNGVALPPHVSMREKRDYFAKNYDHLRRFLMNEPRGHADMFGAVIADSFREECNFGVFFMDPAGYLDFCGHGIIAASTVMMNIGELKTQGPNGNLKIETPAGVVKAHAISDRGAIGWEGVPSFLAEAGMTVNCSVGRISADIAYGGNYFAFVKSSDIGISVKKENIPRLMTLALEIRDKVNEREWIHPENGRKDKVKLVEILDEPIHPEAKVRNILIYGDGQLGRDPCGSGLSAKIAVEVAKGHLKMNEEYVYEGILGTVFRGKAIKKQKIGSGEGIVPEIEGKSFITGMNQFILEENDPFPEGWLLR